MRTARLATVRVALVALGLPLAAATSSAQAEDGPSLRAHRFTLGGGITWSGGYDIGDATATLRGNAVGTSAPAFTLFRAQTAVDAAVGAEARIGFAVWRSLLVDVGFAYAEPHVTTRLSEDDEAPAATLDAERLSQYVIDVGVQWQLPRPVIANRLRVFVMGGGGYLRQLYSERTLVETGQVYSAGAGVRYWLRGGDGTRRSLGLRGDVRAQWRVDGVEFEGRTRVAPVVAIQLFAEL